MSESRKLRINPFVILLLIVLVFFGSCAYTARYFPKFAFIASSILFLGLGFICTRFGRDGVILGVAIIVGAIGLFIYGLLS